MLVAPSSQLNQTTPSPLRGGSGRGCGLRSWLNDEQAIRHPPRRVHAALPHDSGAKHVAGRADYIDDLPEPDGTLHAYLGLSERAHAEIVSIDLEAVRKAPGVVGVLTAGDIPGENDISSVHKHDEPVFAAGEVLYWGQPIFAVIGETREAARRACRLARIEYRDLPPVIDVDAALAAGGKLVTEPLKLERGDVAAGLARAQRRITGTMLIGGQEHFYLESQVALAVPGEDDEVTVHSLHPAPHRGAGDGRAGAGHPLPRGDGRTCAAWAAASAARRRRATLFAAVAALAAKKFNRAVKLRPDRDDDFIDHRQAPRFPSSTTTSATTTTARIEAVDAIFAARSGFSADLTGPVTDRALFHADNAYWYPAVRVRSEPLFTNTVVQHGLPRLRRAAGDDRRRALDRGHRLCAGQGSARDPQGQFLRHRPTDNVTPYHQTVEDNIIHRIVDELEAASDYQARRQAVLAFNEQSRDAQEGHRADAGQVRHLLHRHLAQPGRRAGARLSRRLDPSQPRRHRDGAGAPHQGGAGAGRCVPGRRSIGCKINATNTGKVPNTSATAASSGTDLNGMAA